MSTTLILAIVFINLAMLLYTVGVWAERFQRILKWWHCILFWCGLVSDTIGTTEMSRISGSLIKFNFHGMTGMTAILLMMFHAVWATIVLIQRNENRMRVFHKFSIVVWAIWLIPMISGMFFGAAF
jgi:uncharacterized repeat protein (TIGR03987 family)